MNNLYLLIICLFVFFMISIGEIFKLKKEVRKLNRIVKNILDKRK